MCFLEFSAILEFVLFIPVCEHLFVRALPDFDPKEQNL